MTGRRSSPKNMCSVRQRPMPWAPNSRARRASSGVSAFARTPSRRASSAHAVTAAKSSVICGGTSGTAPWITRPRLPSIEISSPSDTVVPFTANRRADSVDAKRLDAAHARLPHAARDDGGVRRHAAVGREHALRLDHAVDVVRRRLPPDEDHRLAGPAARLGGVGVEHRPADRRTGRGVEAPGEHLVIGGRVDRRVHQLVELAGVDPLHGLVAPDHAFGDKLTRDAHRGLRGPLARARLEDVEPAPLDRELDVLKVAVVGLQRRHRRLELAVRGTHLSLQLADWARRPDPRDDILALRIDEKLAEELAARRWRGSG